MVVVAGAISPQSFNDHQCSVQDWFLCQQLHSAVVLPQTHRNVCFVSSVLSLS